MFFLVGCEGAIAVREPPIAQAPVSLRCKTPGQGTKAKMRLLWRSAYLAELNMLLGPGAADAAGTLGLSPAGGKNFAYESAGSLVTDTSLESLANSADAVAVWALSSDANAKSVFGCNARTLTGVAAETCFSAFVAKTGSRLLRHTIARDDAAEVLAFFQREALTGESEGTQEGFRQGLASLLMHPGFLYVRDVPVGQSADLEPFSIASRLSFALTGHGPDDELFAAASNGALARDQTLQTQVERLMKTPEAHERSLVFYRQWLGYGTGSVSYSEAFLNGLETTGLAAAATSELDGFVSDLTWNKKTPADLLTSTATLALPASLAAVYGAAPGATALPGNRSGLLTRAGMLASGTDDWHVVARGLTVARKFLCKSIAQPTINTADAARKAEALKVSNLDRIKAVTSSADCAACHTTINPLGGARSDFDSIGRAVTVEKHFAGGMLDFEVPVVSASDLSVPLGRSASSSGSLDLSTLIASSPEYDSCFAQQYTQHVLGRDDESNGCVEENAVTAITNGGTILEAMTAAVTSADFMKWKE